MSQEKPLDGLEIVEHVEHASFVFIHNVNMLIAPPHSRYFEGSVRAACNSLAEEIIRKRGSEVAYENSLLKKRQSRVDGVLPCSHAWKLRAKGGRWCSQCGAIEEGGGK